MIVCVTYWPSTEPSIKRCTCVNKWKQVEVRQLYNQVPQTAWVSSSCSWSSSSSCSWSQLGDKMPAWESACRLGACGPQWPTIEQTQPRWGRRAAMVRRTLGQYVAVCPPSPTHFSHATNITLSRIKCKRYIFYKEVCSFVHWSSSLLYGYGCEYTTFVCLGFIAY